MVEPIQGEAGVIVPDDGYLKKELEKFVISIMFYLLLMKFKLVLPEPEKC